VRRDLGDGYDLDDDPGRVDREAVHTFLSNEAYWALGRPRATQDELLDRSQRVVSLFHEGRQVGFSRAVTDGTTIVYLADVYVHAQHRGRGLGLELVREMVERGPYADRKWILHTEDAHDLYRRLGFREPSRKVMERIP
jgi:ribosomal protein S18 acetylase RimI-like enzyme